jgi:hypothetical protein
MYIVCLQILVLDEFFCSVFMDSVGKTSSEARIKCVEGRLFSLFEVSECVVLDNVLIFWCQ